MNMSESKQPKWGTLLFFLPTSLVMAYFVFYLATFNGTDAHAQSFSQSKTNTYKAPNPAKFTLTKGQTTTLERMELTYQGLESEKVVIDITLLDLDPNYAYRRVIPRHSSKIRLAQKNFRILSATASRLKIIRIKG